MVLGRTRRVPNSPKRVHRSRPRPRVRAKHKRRASSSDRGNPAYMLTLGPMNPKRSNTVAKHRKRKAHRARNVSHARSRSRRGGRKVSVSARSLMALARGHRHSKNRRHHRRSRNPMATSISLARPASVVQAAIGVLVGVAATRAIVAALPANITANNMYSTIAAIAVAVGIWWVGSMISPEFGAAAGLGGIAEAGSVALNTFLPQVGSYVSLGDFVPGRFAVPQNPVLDAATGLPKRQTMMVSAYPKAYAAA
jgi:hypothetical protein